MITTKHSGSIARCLKRVSLASFFLRAMKTRGSARPQTQAAAVVVVSAAVAEELRQPQGTQRQLMQIRPHKLRERREHRLRCRLILRVCSSASYRSREFQNANTLSYTPVLRVRFTTLRLQPAAEGDVAVAGGSGAGGGPFIGTRAAIGRARPLPPG